MSTVTLVDRFPRLALALEGRGDAIVEHTAAQLAEDMRSRVAVLTGATEESIRAIPYEGGAAVAADFPWFLIEHGTARGMPAQPFVAPALEDARAPFFAALASGLFK